MGHSYPRNVAKYGPITQVFSLAQGTQREINSSIFPASLDKYLAISCFQGTFRVRILLHRGLKSGKISSLSVRN